MKCHILGEHTNICSTAIPVTGFGDPWGCEMSKLPHFLDNRLLALCVGCPLHYSFFNKFVELINIIGKFCQLDEIV